MVPRVTHTSAHVRIGAAAGARLAELVRPEPEFRSRTGPASTGWHTLDRLELSPDALAMNRLLRLWGAVSSLFGNADDKGNLPLLDLRGLEQALQEARQRAEEVRQRAGVLDTLKASALREAEALVARYYGLQGDGAPLRVVLHDDMGSALASVSYRYDSRGRMTDQHLNINLSQFLPDSGPNGTNDHVIENDRIVAHEVTHAVMGRNIDVGRLPDWFLEGTAEYIAGGAERVRLALGYYSPQRLVDRLTHPWQGDSSQYAAGYIAVRYLDEATAKGGGLKAIMARLTAGDSLDAAITAVSGGKLAGVEGLLREVVVHGAGVALVERIAADNSDAGSIKPGRGPEIVPDRRIPSNQPMKGFRVQWPSPLEGVRIYQPVSWFGVPGPAGAAAAYQRFMPAHFGARIR